MLCHSSSHLTQHRYNKPAGAAQQQGQQGQQQQQQQQRRQRVRALMPYDSLDTSVAPLAILPWMTRAAGGGRGPGAGGPTSAACFDGLLACTQRWPAAKAPPPVLSRGGGGQARRTGVDEGLLHAQRRLGARLQEHQAVLLRRVDVACGRGWRGRAGGAQCTTGVHTRTWPAPPIHSGPPLQTAPPPPWSLRGGGPGPPARIKRVGPRVLE